MCSFGWLAVDLIAPTLDLRDWDTQQAFGLPHEPLARWLVPRIPSHNYCTVLYLLLQMPMQGAVSNIIAAPQGVLRNVYPLKGYCQDKCDDININLFKGWRHHVLVLYTCCHGLLVAYHGLG